jgi:hypothetical protein
MYRTDEINVNSFIKNRKKYENNSFLEKNATRVKIEKQVKEVNKF